MYVQYKYIYSHFRSTKKGEKDNPDKQDTYNTNQTYMYNNNTDNIFVCTICSYTLPLCVCSRLNSRRHQLRPIDNPRTPAIKRIEDTRIQGLKLPTNTSGLGSPPPTAGGTGGGGPMRNNQLPPLDVGGTAGTAGVPSSLLATGMMHYTLHIPHVVIFGQFMLLQITGVNGGGRANAPNNL